MADLPTPWAPLAETAEAENRACEAVVIEFGAWLVQNGAPAVASEMCTELAKRIELRRVVDRLEAHRG